MNVLLDTLLVFSVVALTLWVSYVWYNLYKKFNE